MSLPTTLDAYPDCIEIFNLALEKKQRVAFSTKVEANIFQLRMCTARSLHRDENRRLYPFNDPRHGRSPYYTLVVRKPVEDENGEWWVYIEPHGGNALAIEAA